MNDTRDEELMLAFAAGDAAAFDRLYARHKGPLFRYLKRQTGNHAVCEELFQDVWLKLVNARLRYEATAKFTTWLYRIAHNTLIDHYRQSGRLPTSYTVSVADADCDDPVVELSDPGQIETSDRVALQQQCDHLAQLVEQLPEAQREAFMLQHDTGLAIQAIAEATGSSRETIKSRLRYAMNALRKGMQHFFEDEAGHD